MAGKLLPDSNAFIALMRGDAGVAELFEAASEVILSVVVLGELTYGALNSRSTEANLARLEGIRAACTVVPVDISVPLKT